MTNCSIEYRPRTVFVKEGSHPEIVLEKPDDALWTPPVCKLTADWFHGNQMAFRRPKHASIKSGFDVDFLRYLENTARFTTVTTSAAAAINLKPLAKEWVPFARSAWAPFTFSTHLRKRNPVEEGGILQERKKNKRGFCSMGGAGGCVAGPFDVITQGYSATQGGEGRNKAADRRMQGSKLTPGDTRRRERRISNNRYVQNPSKIVEPGW